MSSFAMDTLDDLEFTTDELDERMQFLFSSIPRSDQRRWAGIFVRGLLSVPGRKSIAKISDYIAGGGAEQSLQQFISQSTWRWDEVRRDLAQRMSELGPRLWVIKEVVFPKNGASSVGVSRQFAAPEGRVLNCQLALAAFLVGDGWSCPVNWRLLLPPSWDNDASRRKKAHLPEDERAVPHWQSMIDMIDEMTVDWGLNPIPVVVDMSHQRDLDAVLRALEERRMHYALKVDPNQRALTIRSGPGAAGAVSFARFIADSLSRNTIIVNTWGTPANRPGRVRLLAARLPPAALSRAQVDSNAPGPAHSVADRYIATEWSPARNSPLAAWVSAPDPRRAPGPMADVGLHHQATADLDEMHDGLGLRHFEGRSFSGWHHHVTLVSVAHSYHVLQGIADGKKEVS
jgi:DDE superfamily endonuclease